MCFMVNYGLLSDGVTLEFHSLIHSSIHSFIHIIILNLWCSTMVNIAINHYQNLDNKTMNHT